MASVWDSSEAFYKSFKKIHQLQYMIFFGGTHLNYCAGYLARQSSLCWSLNIVLLFTKTCILLLIKIFPIVPPLCKICPDHLWVECRGKEGQHNVLISYLGNGAVERSKPRRPRWSLDLDPGVPLGSCYEVMKEQKHKEGDANSNANYSYY